MRLLILAPSCPFPPQDGVRLRIVNLIQRLPPTWQMTLICFDDIEMVRVESRPELRGGSMIRVPRPRPAIGWRGSPWAQLLCRQPTMLWKFQSAEFARITREQASKAEGVLAVGLQLGQYLAHVPSDAAIAIDNYNVETLILERLAETRTGLRRCYWRAEAAKMRRAERAILRATPLVFAISDVDRAAMEAMAPFTRICTVPMALDLQHFAGSGDVAPTPARYTFVGAFNWHVNEDAAGWLADEVWPLIRAKRRDAELHLVGRAPSAVVQKLAERPSIYVSGTVPDVRPYLWNSTALLAPLRYGSGVRTKILEAFAAGRPVVSTSVGCEGLPVRSGEHLLIADSPGEFARCCLQLDESPDLAAHLVAGARRLVQDLDDRATLGLQKALCLAFKSPMYSFQMPSADAHTFHH